MTPSQAGRRRVSGRLCGQRCAGQRGAGLEHPFGAETAVFKVAGKVFALVSEDGASPGHQPQVRAGVRGVAARDAPGDRPPATTSTSATGSRSRSTAACEGDLLDELVDGSYDLVVAKLPRHTRDALAAGDG